MKQLKQLPKLAALSLLVAIVTPVMAQQAGDNVVNVGWAHIKLHESSEPLKIRGVPVPGSSAGVENADTLLIQLTHFFTDNIALSTDLGIPPTMKLNGQGSLQGVGRIGTAKLWSPALIAKYYFGDAKSSFRPYVGAGVSYVRYSDVKLNSGFTQALASKIPVPSTGTSADLSSSFVPVANMGLVYNFDQNWSANLSLSYVPLKTKADLTTQTAIGPIHSTTKITLNPLVSVLSIGYKF